MVLRTSTLTIRHTLLAVRAHRDGTLNLGPDHNDATQRMSEHSGVQGQGLRKGCNGEIREVVANKIEGLIFGIRLGYLLYLYFLKRACYPLS